MAATTATPHTRSRIPSAPVFVAAVYALSVLVPLTFIAAVAVLNLDPEGSSGPLQMLADISLFGTTALALGVLPGLYVARTPGPSRVGAITYGALAILTLPFFWSGAPGVLGAVAAWLGGLTRGRMPVNGAARVLAIIGLCVAILNCVTAVVGTALDVILKLL